MQLDNVERDEAERVHVREALQQRGRLHSASHAGACARACVHAGRCGGEACAYSSRVSHTLAAHPLVVDATKGKLEDNEARAPDNRLTASHNLELRTLWDTQQAASTM